MKYGIYVLKKTFTNVNGGKRNYWVTREFIPKHMGGARGRYCDHYAHPNTKRQATTVAEQLRLVRRDLHNARVTPTERIACTNASRYKAVRLPYCGCRSCAEKWNGRAV